jgi:hypothetical protein
MHSHENPNPQLRENLLCIAALQIMAGSPDDLCALASGGA